MPLHRRSRGGFPRAHLWGQLRFFLGVKVIQHFGESKHYAAFVSKALMDIVPAFQNESKSLHSRSDSRDDDAPSRKSSNHHSTHHHSQRKTKTKNHTRPLPSRREMNASFDQKRSLWITIKQRISPTGITQKHKTPGIVIVWLIEMENSNVTAMKAFFS